MNLLSNYLASLGHLFFPHICVGCSGLLTHQEKVLCVICEARLPKTLFHRINHNPVEKIFWGRIPFIHASSFLFYEKGSITKNLMRLLKYKNRPDIGAHLGDIFAHQLSEEAPQYGNINAIVPIPLHPKKLKKRGYNQCAAFADALGKVLHKEVLHEVVVRTENTVSQTGKTRMDRWKNVSNIFKIKDTKALKRKHILLIDDIVTTGATLEACANEILQIEGTAISIATLAVTP